MKTQLTLIAIALVIASGAPAPPQGEHPPPPPPTEGDCPHGPPTECKADADKFCAGLKRHELRKCMHEHEAELSEACTNAIKQGPPPPPREEGDRPHGPPTECKADADKFCAGLERHELRKCMHEHEAELSEACTNAIKQGPPPPPRQGDRPHGRQPGPEGHHRRGEGDEPMNQGRQGPDGEDGERPAKHPPIGLMVAGVVVVVLAVIGLGTCVQCVRKRVLARRHNADVPRDEGEELEYVHGHAQRGAGGIQYVPVAQQQV